MSDDPQKRRNQGRMAAMFTMLVVLITMGSILGGGIGLAIPLAAVGLAIGTYFAVRGMKMGRSAR